MKWIALLICSVSGGTCLIAGVENQILFQQQVTQQFKKNENAKTTTIVSKFTMTSTQTPDPKLTATASPTATFTPKASPTP